MKIARNKRFLKLSFLLSLMFITGLMASGIAGAGQLVTSLAPQYQDVPFKAENAFFSAAPMMDPKDGKKPLMIEVTDKYEKLEVPMPKGFKISAFEGGAGAAEIISYLKNSPEMTDSAKLRVIARMKKLALIIKSGDQARGEFYKKQVSAPLVLFVNLNMGTGPACAPVPMHLDLKDGGKFFFNTAIFIEDIPEAFSVTDAIKNDTFDFVVAHENAHGIMFDMYGPAITKIEKKSNLGHDGPVVSDRGLAFIEGWAEAFEALYGPTNPLLKLKESEREQYRISEFLFTRQDPVRRDRYIWQNYKGQKTGVLKNGVQILSTEGAIAGLFYDMLTSKAIKDPFGKAISVMCLHHPLDFAQFVKAWVKEFSEDKKVLYRIFLEGTNYATVSNEARKLYYDYYQAKLKYVQKQMDEKTFYTVKAKWTTYKESLFAEIMKSDNLTTNVSPDLWVEVKGFKTLSLQGLLSKVLGMKRPYLNMASVTAGQIKQIQELGLLKNFADEDIQQFVKTREQMGVMPYKTGTEAIREILGKDKANKVIKENNITDVK
ncbi:MAG: hypothetical protein A2008_10680 [Candidatus Wallbacteria bacterium GWC2_49_35]|uniref:Peptidase M48 domain-containing protein n=1 Tax=Candidatus Wallbacteria bacterium GWC2_49_35 TaxID=1817813 RepID=A0A1F7WTH2_9BACT|nr:MAG: hypothetical protein A2008_10680 [Candidatus Wallbacteria bacterium GWC2_49_35]